MKWSDQVEDEDLTSDPAYGGCRQRRCQKVEKLKGKWRVGAPKRQAEKLSCTVS